MCYIALYLRQQNNGRRNPNAYDMCNFVQEIVHIEQCIGGNINIFDEILKNAQTSKNRQNTIKELFITEKEKKKRDRKEKYSSSLITNCSGVCSQGRELMGSNYKLNM